MAGARKWALGILPWDTAYFKYYCWHVSIGSCWESLQMMVHSVKYQPYSSPLPPLSSMAFCCCLPPPSFQEIPQRAHPSFLDPSAVVREYSSTAKRWSDSRVILGQYSYWNPVNLQWKFVSSKISTAQAILVLTPSAYLPEISDTRKILSSSCNGILRKNVHL